MGTFFTFDLIGEFFFRVGKRDKKRFMRYFLPLIREFREITLVAICNLGIALAVDLPHVM